MQIGHYVLVAEFACSFCGKSQHEVARLVAGPGVFICNECAGLCLEVMTQEAPRPPGPVFPDFGTVPEVPGEGLVSLHYDKGENRLTGTWGDQPVEWTLFPHRRVSGSIGATTLEATWTSGDNYVPTPGGWVPYPGYVSDFPNIPADLTGSVADRAAELHGVFNLDSSYLFRRGSIVGRIGDVRLEATVLAASGGFSSSCTVTVEGTHGNVSFKIFATIDGGLERGLVHGSVDEVTVHLDLVRPMVRGTLRDPDNGQHEIDLPGPNVEVSGRFHGPPELLALTIGALLEFL